ncbi:MAG: ATP-dependent helicase, partial [Actinomycetota bacterium]|nr:ATP-dependent helicase [Actinomycetota bacterium]
YGGTRPEKVLALTFTVKAAEEMRKRLLGALKEQALKLTVANFHSYALEIVEESSAVLGLQPEAPVLRRGRAWLMLMDEFSSEDLSLKRLDLADPATAADKALVLLSRAKNDLVNLGDLRRRTEADFQRAPSDETRRLFEERLDLVELAERFEKGRTERGLLRYEDMLELGARVLSDPAMGAPYRGRYDLIVVDEFQDTNPAQMRFVELLAGGDLSRVVVVGDDLQSIYAFTGAEVRNIQRFELAAGLSVGEATYRLTTNFRSGRTILELANHIACQVHPENSPDEPKVLSARPDAPDGEVSAFVSASDTEEAREIARRIKTLVEDGVSPGSCAVLIRRNPQAVPLISALAEEGIPCEIADAGGLLSRPEITLLSDYLRLAATPHGARESLLRALMRHPVLLDENDLRSVLECPGGPEAALGGPQVVPRLSEKGAARLRRFAEILNELEGELAASDSLGSFVERAIEAVGLGHELRSSPRPEARIALQYLAMFCEVAREFGDARFLQEFLRYLGVVSGSGSADFSLPPSEHTDAVRVLTVHKAKGLEFDHVFIPGLSDGVFPSGRAQDSALEKPNSLPPPLKRDPDPELAAAYDTLDKDETKKLLKRGATEEEGRLFYVACTRAAETLTLSRAHYYGDNKKPKKPSVFWKLLEDAPEECAVSVDSEAEVPESNPNVKELSEKEARTPDPWPLEAMAADDETEVAERLGVTGWEDELAALRRDVRAIPESPRPEHVLPPPETHSPSSLMDLETCPRRYYHKYIFPVPILEQGVEDAQDYGSVVHAYIEGGMRGEPPKASYDSGEGDGHAFRKELWKAFDASEYGRRAAEYPLHEGSEPPKTGPARMVEISFALPIENTEIRGRIDAIFVDEDGTFHLVDWKTGKPYESYRTRLQLPLYALAANRLWDIEPQKMRLAYAFVPGDAIVEVSTEGDFLGRAEEKVIKALGLIKSGRFEPTPSRYA